MLRANVTVAFGEKRLLANVNSTADDFDPWLSADGLLLLFHSNRLGDDDLFWASRSTVDDDFGAPRAITELNSSGYADSAPTLTRDHGRLIFASTRGGDEQLYEAVSRD
jgi:Tol biopolymer transport system component